MKTTKWIIVILLALITSGFIAFYHGKVARESIIFFPIDDSVTFDKASTSLQFAGKKMMMSISLSGMLLHLQTRKYS
jgi:hypothetical protein